MYCKKCGRALESMSGQCPYCHTEICCEGGNGFWDLAERPAANGSQLKQPQQPPRVDGEMLAVLGRIERLLATEKQKKALNRLSLLASLCLLLSVLALLLTTFNLSLLRKQLEGVEDGVSLLVTEAQATPEPTVEPSLTPEPTVEPSPSPSPLPTHAIIKQPSAETQALG